MSFDISTGIPSGTSDSSCFHFQSTIFIWFLVITFNTLWLTVSSSVTLIFFRAKSIFATYYVPINNYDMFTSLVIYIPDKSYALPNSILCFLSGSFPLLLNQLLVL